jgi:hypothetical protein
VRLATKVLALAAVMALGACAMPDTESFRAPDMATLFARRSVTNFKEKVLPPVAPENLVDASGRCALAVIPAAPAEGQAASGVSLPDAGVPMIPAAISLEMSECDVVKRAGFADKVDIGKGDRGERTVTLTFLGGRWPGVYRFADGRLKSMERASEPPAPAKPIKKNAKPAKRAPRPAQASVQ